MTTRGDELTNARKARAKRREAAVRADRVDERVGPAEGHVEANLVCPLGEFQEPGVVDTYLELLDDCGTVDPAHQRGGGVVPAPPCSLLVIRG